MLVRSCALSLLLAVSPIRALAQDLSNFETVNFEPQLTTSGPHKFYVYWGVWRTFSPSERSKLRSQHGGKIFSERKISWKTYRCDTGALVNSDSEDVWYTEPVFFDSHGQVEPLPEANRPDYRYFSLLNLQGEKLAGPAATSLQGLRGEVEVETNLSLFGSRSAPSSSGFLEFRQFQASPLPIHQQFFSKTHPARWPVYYDERAHKDHSLAAPRDFQKWLPQVLTQDRLQMTLVWESCDGRTIGAEGKVPGGVIPQPGPNRPGREDHGEGSLPISPR